MFFVVVLNLYVCFFCLGKQYPSSGLETYDFTGTSTEALVAKHGYFRLLDLAGVTRYSEIDLDFERFCQGKEYFLCFVVCFITNNVVIYR